VACVKNLTAPREYAKEFVHLQKYIKSPLIALGDPEEIIAEYHRNCKLIPVVYALENSYEFMMLTFRNVKLLEKLLGIVTSTFGQK